MNRIKNYNGIDIMKMIMAILVVFIHLCPFSDYNNELNFFSSITITRIAVPYFFIASGFFLRNKINSAKSDIEIKNIVKIYVKKLLLLYILWSIIYLPYSIYIIIKYDKSILLYIQECVFEGSHVHLWYLPALMVAILLAIVIYKKIGMKKAMILASLLYFIGLLDISYYGIVKNQGILNAINTYDKLFLTTRNGVFFGLIFVLLGFYATEKDCRQNRNIVSFVLSVIALLIEIYALRYCGIARSYDMVLFSVPVTFSLFKIVQQMQIKDKAVYFHFRKLSSYIYFSHLWIAFLLEFFVTKVLHIRINSLANCLLVLLILILSYIGIIKIKSKKLRILLDKIF